MNNIINTSFNTLMKNPDGSPIEISINSTTKKSKVTINTLNKTLSATKKKNSQKITYEEKESRKYRRVTLNYDANHIPTSLILDIATFLL